MPQPNEIIAFLEGHWQCENIVINDQGVETSSYEETMEIVDENTLRITAHGFREGNDLQKDMRLALEDEIIIMSQDDFIAKGTYRGNVVKLINSNYQGRRFEIHFRFIDKTFVYQMDIIADDKVVESQFSYLKKL